MENILTKIIKTFDKNIHPKRIDKVKEYANSIIITIGAIIFSVMIGIIGFMLIEGFNFLDAFYMTMITVSTVGFGEVRELSSAGRVFVSLLIIFNIGVFFYGISNLANFFVTGEARRIFNDLFVGRKIDKMKNHVIVCGYGRYGSSVVKNLIDQGIEVVLVEAEIEKVEKVRDEKVITVLEGDATDEETLREAGVDHARAIITTLPIDADNVYTILTARQMNPNLDIISRANSAASQPVMVRAGADHVLIPESIGGFYMSALITKPDIVNVFSEFSGYETDNFRMSEMILNPMPDRLRGKTLSDLGLEKNTGVKIIGLKHKNEKFTVNPTMDLPLLEGDAILVVGNQNQINRFHTFAQEFEIIE